MGRFGLPQSLQQDFTASPNRDWILVISECTFTSILMTLPFSRISNYYSDDFIYLAFRCISPAQDSYSKEYQCTSVNVQYRKTAMPNSTSRLISTILLASQCSFLLECSSYKKVLEPNSFSRFSLFS